MLTKIRVIQLQSGLFQGIIEGDILCFVARDRPEEALNDAKELLERYNVNKIR